MLTKKSKKRFGRTLSAGFFLLVFIFSTTFTLLTPYIPTASAEVRESTTNSALLSDFGLSTSSDYAGLIRAEWIDAANLKVYFTTRPDAFIIFKPYPTPGSGSSPLIEQRYEKERLEAQFADDNNADNGYEDTGDDDFLYTAADWGGSSNREGRGNCYATARADTDRGIVDTETVNNITIDIDFKENNNSACTDTFGDGVSVDIAKPELSAAFFRWVDEGRIEIVDSLQVNAVDAGTTTIPSSYVRSPTNPSLFLEDGVTTCPDAVLITASDKTRMKYYQLQSADVSDDNDLETAPSSLGFSGCEMLKTRKWEQSKTVPSSDMEFAIANVAAATLAAGEGERGEFGEADSAVTCEIAADWAFGFIICPILAMADTTIVWLDDQITDALEVSQNYFRNDEVKEAWGNVRNIAIILLIPVALLMVIGTALQFSFVDAYTVKKALPRLFFAIIFISLSFDIAGIMVDITNTVGQGIAGIIAAPFGPEPGGLSTLTLRNIFNPGAGDGQLFGIGILAGIGVAFLSGVTLFSLLSFMLTAALALLIIFILLTVRELMIVFLIVISPIAIITWIFPGNDKGWKLWWSTFSKLLLLYPIIMSFIAMGKSFAYIVNIQGDNDNQAVSAMVKLTAFIGPYFFIPKAFQMAGGAFASLAGMANNREKGVFDRLKKGRADQRKKKREDIASGKAFKGGQAGTGGLRGNLSSLGQNAYMRKKAAQEGGLSKFFDGKAVNAAAQRKELDEKEHAQKDGVFMTKLKNDDFAHIMMLDSEAARVEYLMKKGYSAEAAKQESQQATVFRREHGDTTAKLLAIEAKAASKTSYTGGISEMLEDIKAATHGDESMAMTMLGSASAAAAAAGRFDLGGGSYGEKAAMMKAMMFGKGDANNQYTYTDDNGQTQSVSGAITADQVNQRQASKARDGLTAYDYMRMHPTAARNIANQMSLDMGSAVQQVESTQASIAMLKAKGSNRTPEETQKMVQLEDALPQREAALGEMVAQFQTLQASSSSMPPEVGRIIGSALETGGPIVYGNKRYANAEQVSQAVMSGNGSEATTRAYNKRKAENPLSGIGEAVRQEMMGQK